MIKGYYSDVDLEKNSQAVIKNSKVERDTINEKILKNTSYLKKVCEEVRKYSQVIEVNAKNIQKYIMNLEKEMNYW